MKYKFKIIYILRKIFLSIYFKIDRVGCSRLIGVTIGENCKIYGGNIDMWGTEPFLIEIGDNVHITDGCKFINHDGGTLILRRFDPTLEITDKIKVGNHVYLGIDTLVLPGVIIGDNVIVGARSIVTRSLLPDSVYVGSPAKFVRTVDDYLKRISEKSLGIGNLSADEKEMQLKEIFRDD